MRIRVFGQYLQLSIAVLTVAEGALFFAVLIGAAVAYFKVDLATLEISTGALWPRALLFSSVMVVSLLAVGLYSARQRARTSGILARVIVAVTAGIVVTAGLSHFIPNLRIEEGVLGYAALGATGALVASRLIFSQLADENLFKRRVLVYGSGKNAAAISNLRRRADRRGFVLAGFVRPDGEGCVIAPQMMLDPAGGHLADLCSERDVDEVVVAMDDRRRGFPILELLECRLAGIDVTELLSFLERETGRVRIDVLNPSWMIFGEGFRRDTLRLMSSRALDLLASSVLVLIALPFMFVTAIAIKLEDGWGAPVLYRQERVGLGGRTFRLLKFRSMRTDAEAHGAQWAQKGDSRVTRVGAFIRKCRIDELPQILNVLRGHMSFVGPRPERPEFVADLAQKIPYYVQRHCVKPGITGWAQLCYPYGSSEQDALEKLQYDLYYIKNNSLLFDLAILVQTAEVVFMGQGAR
jgi:sugar transferase (PEP-CTERM system associated)